MARLIIGAAHTSVSPGAIYKDLREFDLTRKLLELVSKHLEKNKVDFKAVPADLQLLQRIDWINDTGYTEDQGDVFLEIHINDGGKRGIESWYSDEEAEDNNSQKFAEFIVDKVSEKTKYENQGAKSEFDHELGSLLILNQTNPISIAVEFLYIDNEEDYKILKDESKLEDLAKNISESLKEYLISADKHQVKKKPKAGIKKDPFDFGNFGKGLNFGGNNNNSSDSNLTMDREQRKAMIEDTYKEFGLEVKQSDLNYYLNTGVSKNQLLEKIIKSKDFKEMTEDAKEYKEKKEELEKQEAEVIKLKSQVRDLVNMHKKLNELLAHKNHQLKLMQDELVKRGIIKKGEYYDPSRVAA